MLNKSNISIYLKFQGEKNIVKIIYYMRICSSEINVFIYSNILSVLLLRKFSCYMLSDKNILRKYFITNQPAFFMHFLR